jgi:hypothetical protein
MQQFGFSSARRSPGYVQLRGAALAVGVFFLGCQELPEPRVSRESVLEATKEVVAKRYPMYRASEEGAWVYAVGPVEMQGASKTRKQVSVRVLQNFTGSYDPEVRIRQYAEIGTTPMGGDPEAASVSLAHPLAANQWQPLEYLYYEEQEIYDEIRARLEPKGI